MASSVFNTNFILKLLIVFSLFHMSFGTRKLTALFKVPSPNLTYHNGTLLSGAISINLYWYGSFTAAQRSILSDFIISLSSPPPPQSQSQPTVSSWWQTINKYYALAQPNNPSTLSLSLGNQILDSYSLGKSLTRAQIEQLASQGAQNNAIVVVFTSADVAVERFCMDSCGTHGSDNNNKLVYIWVGDSQTQCPGQCAWPFHQPISGPQTPPLVPPNGDVGCDGMVINFASLLVEAITNPFGNGVYEGQAGAQLEAASACQGIYAKGASAGNPGKLLVDPTTGASYNAVGDNGRKYVVPSMYDPSTSSCSTLV